MKSYKKNLSRWIVFSFALFLLKIANATPDFPSEQWKLGEVDQILINNDGVRDGLLVTEANTKKLAVVKIPPHLWTAQVDFTPGDTIEFTGRQIMAVPNFVFDRVVVKKGNLRIDDSQGSVGSFGAPLAPPLAPEEGVFKNTTVEGTVIAVSADPAGRIDRVILADGSNVLMPPSQAGKTPSLGDRLRVAGRGGTFEGKKSVRTQGSVLAE